jgi:hypothetical protein
MTRYLLLFDICGLVFVGRPLWREDGSVFCICCWILTAQSFLGPTIFYCLRFETFLFVATYDSQGHGGGIRPRLHTGILRWKSKSKSHCDWRSVSQSVSLGIEPHLWLMTRYYCLTVTVLFSWGALSDERTGLSFVYAAAGRFRVRVPWYSRPYFTVSDLRLPFSSPPTTRRVTVEIFEPASTRVNQLRWILYILGTDHAQKTHHCVVAWRRPHRKHSFLYCCVCELLSNGCLCGSAVLAWSKYATV